LQSRRRRVELGIEGGQVRLRELASRISGIRVADDTRSRDLFLHLNTAAWQPEKLTTTCRVSRQDAITLGLRVPMPWPREPSASGTVILRIGRDPDNDYVVDLSTVSGRHARIIWNGERGQAVIEDLGSSNGTALGSPLELQKPDQLAGHRQRSRLDLRPASVLCPSGEVHLQSRVTAGDDSTRGADGPVSENSPCRTTGRIALRQASGAYPDLTSIRNSPGLPP
jgi:hypothetical protein